MGTDLSATPAGGPQEDVSFFHLPTGFMMGVWAQLSPKEQINLFLTSRKLRNNIPTLRVLLSVQLITSRVTRQALSTYGQLRTLHLALPPSEDFQQVERTLPLLDQALSCLTEGGALRSLTIRVLRPPPPTGYYTDFPNEALTAPMLAAVLGHCRMLTQLRVQQFAALSGPALAPMSLCTGLHTLVLDLDYFYASSLAGETLASLPHMPCLQCLVLAKLSSDSHTLPLVAHIPNLTDLTISPSFPGTELSCLEPMLSGLSGLTSLSLQYRDDSTYSGTLNPLLCMLPSLRQLMAPGAELALDQRPAGTLHRIKAMTVWDLEAVGSGDGTIPPGVMPGVTSLAIRRVSAGRSTDWLCSALTAFPDLQRLFLRVRPQVCALAPDRLAAVHSVTAAVPQLYVQAGRIDAAATLQELGSWVNLAGAWLEMDAGYSSERWNFALIHAAVREHLEALPVLKLVFSNLPAVTAGELLELLNGLPALRRLSFGAEGRSRHSACLCDQLAADLVRLCCAPNALQRAAPVTLSLDAHWSVLDTHRLNTELRGAGCSNLSFDEQDVFAGMGLY